MNTQREAAAYNKGIAEGLLARFPAGNQPLIVIVQWLADTVVFLLRHYISQCQGILDKK